MRRDGTRKHGIRPALLPTVVTLVLLMTAAAGARDMDPNDRYTLVGKAIAPKVAQSLTWGIVDTVPAGSTPSGPCRRRWSGWKRPVSCSTACRSSATEC